MRGQNSVHSAVAAVGNIQVGTAVVVAALVEVEGTGWLLVDSIAAVVLLVLVGNTVAAAVECLGLKQFPQKHD